MNIDQYAYNSKLRSQSPGEKLFFAMLTLVVVLWADSLVVSLVVLLLMGLVTIRFGGIPTGLFFKALMVPIVFVFLALFTLCIEIKANQTGLILWFDFFGRTIGISETGLMTSIQLFFRSLASIACLYYLSFNTPMIDIVMTLSKFKCPQLLIEMMSLVYRFIFVLLDTTHTMVNAQHARLGYSTLSAGYRSMASLVGTVFIRSYQQAERNYTALEARGYTGEIKILEEGKKANFSGFLVPIGINGILILLTVVLKSI